MTIQECYDMMGGSYEEVLGRLYSQALVEKFVGKFLADQSFQRLDATLAEGNFEEAFRAGHTLKGVADNLSFTKLKDSSSAITEALRAQNHDQALQLLPQVRQDYERTVEAIRADQG